MPRNRLQRTQPDLLLFNPAVSGRKSYLSKVLGTGPIAYWPLNEPAGATTIVNHGSLGAAANGATGAGTKSPTMGAVAAPGGGLAPSFDGGDYIDIYSAALNGGFNGLLGTVMIWWKVANAGVWADATVRRAFMLTSSTPHYIIVTRNATANQMPHEYNAPVAARTILTSSSVGWNCSVLTFSDAADQFKAFVNNTQVGVTLAMGTWSGTLSATGCLLGANDATPTNPWLGYLAHAAIWNRILTPSEIANLYAWGGV